MFNRIFDTLQNGNDVRGAAIATANEKLSLTPVPVPYGLAPK